MQIDRHGGDGRPERRARLQPGRGLGGDPLATAGATPAEQPRLGHIRPDRRQPDAFADPLRGLGSFRERGLAPRAGRQPRIDNAVRVRMEHPARAGTARARRPGLTVRLVSLLCLGRGFGGIVRGFRRPGQFVEAGFQRRGFLMGRGELREQRQDQRVLLLGAQAGEIGRGHPKAGIDPAVTVSNELCHTPHGSVRHGTARPPGRHRHPR